MRSCKSERAFKFRAVEPTRYKKKRHLRMASATATRSSKTPTNLRHGRAARLCHKKSQKSSAEQANEEQPRAPQTNLGHSPFACRGTRTNLPPQIQLSRRRNPCGARLTAHSTSWQSTTRSTISHRRFRTLRSSAHAPRGPRPRREQSSTSSHPPQCRRPIGIQEFWSQLWKA